MSVWIWVIDLVILALAGWALVRYQATTSTWDRVVAAAAAMILGVLGLVLLGGILLT